MNRALRIARDYGVGVLFDDLGNWGRDELRSEYDPHGPLIRVNSRVAQRLPAVEREAFVALAIGHELYHHREHLGEVPRLAERSLREMAADDFARDLLEH